jgi:hypothetical protein
MEPEGPLPHSQVLATCPYPEPAQPTPHTPAAVSEPALYKFLTYVSIQNYKIINPTNARIKSSMDISQLICIKHHTKKQQNWKYRK